MGGRKSSSGRQVLKCEVVGGRAVKEIHVKLIRN